MIVLSSNMRRIMQTLLMIQEPEHAARMENIKLSSKAIAKVVQALKSEQIWTIKHLCVTAVTTSEASL